jgi:hypothetical protein
VTRSYCRGKKRTEKSLSSRFCNAPEVDTAQRPIANCWQTNVPMCSKDQNSEASGSQESIRVEVESTGLYTAVTQSTILCETLSGSLKRSRSPCKATQRDGFPAAPLTCTLFTKMHCYPATRWPDDRPPARPPSPHRLPRYCYYRYFPSQH